MQHLIVRSCSHATSCGFHVSVISVFPTYQHSIPLHKCFMQVVVAMGACLLLGLLDSRSLTKRVDHAQRVGGRVALRTIIP